MKIATTPAVSIILPTYNRSAFLPQALDSIRSQSFSDWELIVVDDGSTDDSREVLERLGADLGPRLRYLRQENQGFSGARTTGIEAATAPLVAFFDSDDAWLPHHLRDCVDALTAHPEVDWVWGASQIEEVGTGKVLLRNSFYDDSGAPKPFLSLPARKAGRLRILEGREIIRCAIRGGLNCGLQAAVMRRRVFATGQLCFRVRNVAIDQLIIIRALQQGIRFAYYDNVHLLYRVHNENSSAAGAGSLVKKVRCFEDQAWCYNELRRDPRLSGSERRATLLRLAQTYFWSIGYSLYWKSGDWPKAREWYHKGLRLWPWDLIMWRTVVWHWARSLFGLFPKGTEASAPLVQPEISE